MFSLNQSQMLNQQETKSEMKNGQVENAIQHILTKYKTSLNTLLSYECKKVVSVYCILSFCRRCNFVFNCLLIIDLFLIFFLLLINYFNFRFEQVLNCVFYSSAIQQKTQMQQTLNHSMPLCVHILSRYFSMFVIFFTSNVC